jgi:hypothetical protein
MTLPGLSGQQDGSHLVLKALKLAAKPQLHWYVGGVHVGHLLHYVGSNGKLIVVALQQVRAHQVTTPHWQVGD